MLSSPNLASTPGMFGSIAGGPAPQPVQPPPQPAAPVATMPAAPSPVPQPAPAQVAPPVTALPPAPSPIPQPAPTTPGGYYAPGQIPPGATQPWDAPPLPAPPTPVAPPPPPSPAPGYPIAAPSVAPQPQPAAQAPRPAPQPQGPVTIGAGGIPMMGQYVNPLFQQQQQTRDAQLSYINQLQGDMQGNAPSLAQLQLKQGTDANIAAANALAASAGPNNYAAAQRQAMNNAATQGLNLAGQSAALRAQEYASARDAYGQNINQLRGQDYNSTGMSYANAVQQAQLENQMNTTQANLQAGQNQLNLTGAQQYLNMGQAVNNTDLASRTHYLDLMAQKYANDRGIAATAGNLQTQLAQQQNQFNTTRTDNLVNGAVSAGAQWIKDVYGSDENLKTDIEPANAGEMHDFLSSLDDTGPVKKAKPLWEPRLLSDFMKKLEAKSFRYKDEAKWGEGEHTGFLAQDLMKSRIGKTLVVESPDGKMVDVKRASMASLAALASHEKRISALEEAAE